MGGDEQLHPAKKRRSACGPGDIAGGGGLESPNALSRGGTHLVGEKRRRSVLVWDLDETLIVFNSLLDRSFEPVEDPSSGRSARRGLLPPKEQEFAHVAERERLARAWERLVLQVCDEQFFFTSVEDCVETAVGDLAAFDDGKDLETHDFERDGIGELLNSSPEHKRLLAYRLRKASERYAMGANALLAAQPDLRAGWEELYKQTDALTQGWLGAGIFAVTGRRDGLPAGAPPANDAAADADADADAAAGGGGAGAVQPDSEARARSGSSPGADGSPRPSDADGEAEALRRAPRASSPEVDHVLVTAGCLLPTLAKLILFKLDKIFPLTAGAEPDSQCHPCRLRSAGVFSARRDGKEYCFRRIRQRYGGLPLADPLLVAGENSLPAPAPAAPPVPSDGAGLADAGPLPSEAAASPAEEGAVDVVETRFVAIGDGPEEAAAASVLGWPCIRIAPLHGEGAVPIFSLSPDLLEQKLWG